MVLVARVVLWCLASVGRVARVEQLVVLWLLASLDSLAASRCPFALLALWFRSKFLHTAGSWQ